MMISTLFLSSIQTTEQLLTRVGDQPDLTFNFDFLFKILLAIGAGLLIGVEREFKGKDAGLKTNMLVSVGSCVFVFLSLQFQGGESFDPTRVLSQVVTGIGFLGAGVILKKGANVQGLTTGSYSLVQCCCRLYRSILPGYGFIIIYGHRSFCQYDLRIYWDKNFRR